MSINKKDNEYINKWLDWHLNKIKFEHVYGSYTFTVPNGEAETAHHVIVLSLVVNTTGAASESELANCRIEIL